MRIFKASFNGQPNVGLFGYATGSYALLGEYLPPKILADVTDVLGSVPVHHATIAGTGMVGVFCAGNESVLLVPGITFDTELRALERLGIAHAILDTRHTCLGNNIVANEHGAVISSDFSDGERKKIEKLLGVPAIRLDIAGLKTPGAVIVVNASKGIIHRDASDEELAAVEKTLKVSLTPATVNLGTPYLHAAILRNGHGFVVSDACGGPEIVHVDEALGYMEDDDDA
jgi:translation initiation factor 6